jgi:hypothetical protein
LSSAGNTCLSIQSLVLADKFRCRFYVSHSAYPSFWGLMMTEGFRPLYPAMFHRATYKDVGMAVNLNRLIVFAFPFMILADSNTASKNMVLFMVFLCRM